MEFDELQKIWDAHTGQNLFVLNENALHNRIAMKKRKAYHIVNVSEFLLIIVNLAAAIFITVVNLTSVKTNLFMHLLAAWMLLTAVVVFVKRSQRLAASNQFDRSMVGDLQQAIADATWQVNLSKLMRWNIVPIALFSLFGMWQSGKSIWIIIGVLLAFVLAHFASRWEHGLYKSRRRELEVLQQKLKN